MKRIEEVFDVTTEIDDKTTEALITYLEQYTVEFPSEEEIDQSIEALRQYVPRKNESLKKFCELIRLAVGEITYISKIYWIACTILFLAGYLITINQIDPYITIMALAPLPCILGIVEIFKGRDKCMLEIELSCKISAVQLMISRILVIGVYSIFMNTALSIFICMFRSNIDLWKLSVLWLTPLTLVSGISLWIAMKIRGEYAVGVIVSVWLMVIFSTCFNKKFINNLVQFNTVSYLVILSISILMFMLQLKALMSKYNSIFERGNQIEISA